MLGHKLNDPHTNVKEKVEPHQPSVLTALQLKS